MKRNRLTAATLACVVSPAVLLPAITSQAGPPGPAGQVAAALQPGQSRLAFTDERDQVYRADVTLNTFNGGIADAAGTRESLFAPELGFSDVPVHEGELSIGFDDTRVYVSTADSPGGDVYVEVGGEPVRVTCDSAIETHPVVNVAGWIAYSSDRDSDGDDVAETDPDIWVALQQTNVPEDCDDWQHVNITDQLDEGSDLWPSWHWIFGDGGPDTHTLVWSRAEPGQLPDLVKSGVPSTWIMDPDPAAWLPEQLTDTVGLAETQPAVHPLSDDIVFTTTEDRPDGSLRLMDIDDPDDPSNPWVGMPIPASSEPAWLVSSSGVNPYIAYTRRQEDPYGDIATVRFDDPPGPGDPVFFRDSPVLTTPGVAETHPAWLDGFGASDISGTIAYTARVVHTRIDPSDSRVLDADVAEVLLDGTDRAVPIDQTEDVDGEAVRVDEAGPDYSPDGRRIAFSRQVGVSDSLQPVEREIWVADANGGNAAPLAGTGHQPTDRDRDPVWSPDGSRIAFVRESIPSTGSSASPQVMVVDLVAESVQRITPTPGIDTPVDALDNHSWADSDPDWSPDGQRLILRRTLTPCCDGSVIFRPPPGWSAAADRLPGRLETTPTNDDGLWVVPVQENSIGVRVQFCPFAESCQNVTGRNPAWAPDGSAIVYSVRGELVLGTITANTDTAFQVEREQLTGFRASGEPTDAGYVLSRADDPAWAPDSSEIAFSGQPIGQPDQRGIYRIALDGTGLAVVTDGRGPETEPTHQPHADVAVTVTLSATPVAVGDPIAATFTAANDGPVPAREVALVTALAPGAVVASAEATSGPPATCAADGTGCTIPVLAPLETLTYVVTFSHPAEVAGGVAAGTVSASTVDPNLTNNSAEAPYDVVSVPLTPRSDVAVRLLLDEHTGYVGGQRVAQVRVRNHGPQTALGVTVTATWPAGLVATVPVPGPDPLVPPQQPTPACLPAGDPCLLGSLAPGELVVFEVAVATPAEGDHTIDAVVSSTTVDPATANNRSSVELPVLQPSIRLVPAVARPGQVVLAYGEDMPPGTQVVLSWRPGVVLRPGPLTVAPDGTIRNSILIVRREQLGERTITATSQTTEFAPVTGDALVVLRTMSPPHLVGRG
ncbi:MULTISPECIES: DUF11 domain-containing protein [Nocardioides]|uniref:DUF11 domain-containing protein n=1 Tax=Nocardioides vastitatis TaxID=2568655 RepID=A0ABW0ZJI8_9ACTN|nr:DUF11 domain-containing protein [Nocardioides sp.]